MINLVIKGTLVAAVNAADKHGIELHSIAAPLGCRQIMACCTVDYLEAVRAWYQEPSDMTMGIGYTDGVLLHYAVKCQADFNPAE